MACYRMDTDDLSSPHSKDRQFRESSIIWRTSPGQDCSHYPFRNFGFFVVGIYQWDAKRCFH